MRLKLPLLALCATSLLITACDDPMGSDAQTPEITITSPTTDQTVVNDSVVVEGFVEADEPVQRVVYRLNGGAELPLDFEASGNRASFRVAIGPLELGTNDLQIVAYDAGDRAGGAEVTIVATDNTVPQAELSTPIEGDLTERDSLRVTGTVSDDRAVTTLSYALDDGEEVEVAITPAAMVNFEFTARPAPGNHLLVLFARDESGNEARDSVSFTTAAVNVTIVRPSPDTIVKGFSVLVEGTIDASVPVTRVTIRVNGGPEIETCSSQAGRCTVDLGDEHWFTFSVLNPPSGADTVDLMLYGAQDVRLGSARIPFTVHLPIKNYSLTLLRENSTGLALNDEGEAVGSFPTAQGETHAFVWDGTHLVDIGEGLGSKSIATGINEEGVVVGGYENGCPRSFQFRLGIDSPASALPGDCGFTALDVNDSGVILMRRPGSEVTSFAAYLLDSTGTHPLAVNPLSPPAALLALNNSNQVLAYSSSYNALILTTTSSVNLSYCAGTDLNNEGDVLTFPCKGSGATVIRADGSVVNITGLGLQPPSPAALNDQGEVAGMYEHPLTASESESRPFLWDGTSSTAVNLGVTDWKIDSVVDLNNSGTILAQATNTRTRQHGAVLLRPID